MRRHILRCTVAVAVAVFLSVGGVVVTAEAAPGDLDTIFDPAGHDGIILAALATSNGAAGVALQPDGKIVVAISADNNSHFGVFRYNVDGSLDTTFGSGGLAIVTAFTGVVGAVAIQPDGKIVVAGGTTAGDFAVVCLHPNGSLDTSFDTDGIVTTDLGSAEDQIRAVALQSDGKIVLAGLTRGLTTDWDFAVVRLNTDGSRDATFGSNGIVATSVTPGNFLDSTFAVAVETDGKIVAGGFTTPAAYQLFAIVRYNTNGSLDPVFGGDGTVTTDFGIGAICTSLAIQPDGRIVAGGHTLSSHQNFALARYTVDGILDTTFGGGTGKVTTDVLSGWNSQIDAIALQPDGKIVAAGAVEDAGLTQGTFALARYNPDGSLDTAFGTGGTVTTDLTDAVDEATAVAVQTDGSIVAAGVANRSISTVWQTAVARYIGMVSDLQLTIAGSAEPVAAADGLTYTITIANNGPDPTYGVVVTDTLPAEVAFSSALPTQGACSGTDVVTCDLGSLAAAGSASIDLVVSPSSAGTIANSASVTGQIRDPDAANNSAQATSTVAAASEGGGCTLIPRR
jgi:uncharacterized delta-60 repeat protein/uncharacterized repeat protein (TIGR01451 family)